MLRPSRAIRRPWTLSVIRLITLDLDDTLWDAGPVLARAEEVQYAWISTHAPRIATHYSVQDLQAYRRAMAQADPTLRHDFTALRQAALARLLEEHGYDPHLAQEGVNTFVQARSEVTLFPEVDEVLRQLAKAYRLVGLTNGNTDLVRAGVAHYFEFSLAPADTGTSKPDPRMFEAALQRAGVPAEAAVHVGDEPYYDIEGAHRATVAAVWVNRTGRAWPVEHRPPHEEINNLRLLPDAVARIQQARRQ
ncbi:MAG: HAD family hydrolase [Gammaproteobacteria bacterium]|nr:HAD family hydrolase [Gammaproteobacteria bacterium]